MDKLLEKYAICQTNSRIKNQNNRVSVKEIECVEFKV